ncbi:tripartite ATP-independent transporter DctM subunit [Paracoccus pantotrophus]|uniref:TRAP transporter large permease protein n=1 Tax=Paracoccus pantotrophus TaxID=82367 RepID=A0AAE6TU12_PARPN|nr:TRAP transporter large permease subunit [Paracoccus pantotrophus]QFG37349.1 TRAP transporter large permease subunit [Paracoccus pantotrophus]RKS52212.1 tripartite ATP-independent transporter DctM subunit [Paracoccus pantotrophus]
METVGLSVLVLVLSLALFLGSGVWIALSLLAVSVVMFAFFTPVDAGSILSSTLWDASWNWALTALPLFIWMGEILMRAGLSASLFRGLAPWFGRLPGGLLHVNIAGCGVMAAVAGSSAVTCATVGRMTIPELRERGYDPGMMVGSLAGAGTFGLLIPPSIIMIVYGVVAQQSVARLFVAGIVPGLVLILLFSSYIALWAMLNPDRRGRALPPMTLAQKLREARGLIPVVLLIVAIIGSIYRGFATPTEAATIGIAGAFILSVINRTMSRRMFVDSLRAATRISCMISFIIACAACLSIAVGFADIPRVTAAWVDSLQLSPAMLILVLTLFFLVLGCFLEGISILVLSASVVLPMVQAAGIDLIWFGIFSVIVIECAQITPPVGFNLIVLKSMTGKGIGEIARDTLPFLLLLLAAIVLFWLFPALVTFLPDLMYS